MISYSHTTGTYSGYLWKRSNKPQETISEEVPTLIEEQIITSGIDSKVIKDEQEKSKDLLPVVPILPDLPVPKKIEVKEEVNGLGAALNMLSSFFGQDNKKQTNLKACIGNSLSGEEESQLMSSDRNMEARKPFVPTVAQSKPIAIQKESSSEPIQIGNGTTVKKSKTLPLHLQEYDDTRGGSSQNKVPDVYIDPWDKHVWTRKYCILTDGVLYFYRNAEIGNSHEAELERRRMPITPQNYEADNFDNLGKSPMPRDLHPLLHSKEKTGGSFCHDPNVYWEKRVALNMVGKVKTSAQFGEKVFELIAMRSVEDEDHENDDQDDEDLDTLILKAKDIEEVRTWLLEIRKAFVFLMKELADVVGSKDQDSSLSKLGAASYTPKGLMSTYSVNQGCNVNGTIGPFIAQRPTHDKALSFRGIEKSGSFGDYPALSPQRFSGLQPFNEGSTRTRAGSSDSLQINNLLSPKAFPVNKLPTSRSSTRLSDAFHPTSPKGENASSTVMSAPKKSSTEAFRSPSAGKYVPPQLRNKSSAQKYVPPHMRKNESEIKNIEPDLISEVMEQVRREDDEAQERFSAEADIIDTFDDSEESEEKSLNFDSASSTDSNEPIEIDSTEDDDGSTIEDVSCFKVGGCADPNLISTSVCDDKFKREHSVRATNDFDPYGFDGEKLEVGAVSKCGIRPYNEDAYIIITDLFFTQPSDDIDPFQPSKSYFDRFKEHGLFAIFDGHCGNEAARYAAEKFHGILLEESIGYDDDDFANRDTESILNEILMDSVSRLDDEFCLFCSHEGRDWYSGSTAIIVLVLDDHVAIASVGDAGGVFSSSTKNTDRAMASGWSVLEHQDFELNKIGGSKTGIIFKEVSESHCPSSPAEKQRILSANGWVTHETEIPIAGLFHRMDWGNEDVLEIFLRCFGDRLKTDDIQTRIVDIYRVCGDLAVSRAIGDREYKAEYNRDDGDANNDPSSNEWRCPAFLNYHTYRELHSEEHNGCFEGDLVISTPSLKFFRLGSHGSNEFILIACDGLWDVIDPGKFLLESYIPKNILET